MVDPVSVGVGLGLMKAANSVSKSANEGLLGRALGPLADEIGQELREWRVRKRETNARRILQVAADLAGEGPPNMRVLGEVLEQGSWSDNEVAAGYLGGVLAGSRGDGGLDDGGLPWARLINGLSAAELALHFVVYRTLRLAACATSYDCTQENQLHDAGVWIPLDYWTHVTRLEPDQAVPVLSSAVIGLRRVGLLALQYDVQDAVDSDFPGARVSPTHAGVELFLRGNGVATPTPDMMEAGSELLSSNDALSAAIDESEDGYEGLLPGFAPTWLPALPERYVSFKPSDPGSATSPT